MNDGSALTGTYTFTRIVQLYKVIQVQTPQKLKWVILSLMTTVIR